MKSLLSHFKNIDFVLAGSALLLTAIGLASLYSSSMGRGDFSNFQKQIIFASIGVFLMFLFSLFDYRIFKNDANLILILYIISILGLIGIFFFAPEIRGVRSWYKIGSVSLDPSEFIKLILLFLLA
ncbi:MAG: FtsW/RodA/SpoVE family cell cycle protein, partial [Candidatus Nealsonbacteria bacterium]|nr:FtsW/RodA/SpoVE family cell cycle protein [Candidatus Nealsonbacteria bacterium]